MSGRSASQRVGRTRAIRPGRVGIAMDEGRPFLGGFVAFQQHERNRGVDGKHGLAAFDRRHAAPDVNRGAIWLAREGDESAGKEDAETGRADQRLAVAASCTHMS